MKILNLTKLRVIVQRCKDQEQIQTTLPSKDYLPVEQLTFFLFVIEL